MNDSYDAAPGVGANVAAIDDHQYVRDLVEPVARSRLEEATSVWDFYPDERTYEEWQLPGTDDGGSDVGIDQEDEGARRGANGVNAAFRSMLISEPTADEDENDPRRRFVSFLCNTRIRMRVLWLNTTLFLLCEGPDTYSDCDDEEEHNSLLQWLGRRILHGEYRYCSFSVQTADGRDYSFYLSSSGERDDGRDDGWTTDLLRLFANSAIVRKLTFDHVSQPHLAALVSRAPPPCGRTLDCRTMTYSEGFLTEGAARVLAFQTHRDTELVLYLGDWSWGVPSCVRVLAEAMRSNRCPRRLVLLVNMMGPPSRDDAATLADGIRTTTAVEAITIQISSFSPENLGTSNQLLEAIGRNGAIRRLVVQQRQQIGATRMVDIWNRLLVSRTIESVDATLVEASEEYTNMERRECALHVASLMRSNRVLTELLYDPGTHDAQVMERHVAPFLDLNRFRPVVESWTAAAGPERTLSLVVGSARVRGTPCLLLYVVKMNKEIFASKFSPLPRKRPSRS